MSVFPSEYQVGATRIAPATVLAPMAGVTDTVFRRLIRNQGGCGLIMTEFTSSHGVVASIKANSLKAKKGSRTFRYLYFEPEEHPISAQLFGSDPQVMADAAKACQDFGFDIVDINFGCPVNKVVKCNGGSGLLRESFGTATFTSAADRSMCYSMPKGAISQRGTSNMWFAAHCFTRTLRRARFEKVVDDLDRAVEVPQ